MDALPELELVRPATLDEVIAARAAHPDSRLVGGGTDLVVNIRRGIVAPPDYWHIHEIGGLHTLPQARRQGLARRLVETALATLAAAGEMPRYQVDEANHASIALAQAIGLVPAVTAEHWLHLP